VACRTPSPRPGDLMSGRAFDIAGCRAGLRRRAWCHFCYWLYAKSRIPVQWLPIGEMLSDAGCVAYADDADGCMVCLPRPIQEKATHDD
jgi:hypothetical protein